MSNGKRDQIIATLYQSLLHIIRVSNGLIVLYKFSQGANVGLSHLEGFKFRQFSIIAQFGNMLPQTFKSIIETVHAFSFTGIGGMSSFDFNFGM